MKKSALIILDGWGLETDPSRSAVSVAQTPVMDGLLKTRPNSRLITHGEKVGLPEGQMGNSEVGHLNIGAGRIVYQDLVKINKAIARGELDQSGKIKKTVDYAVENQAHIHLIGLCSEGGVHSHIDHLLGITDYPNKIYLGPYFIHAFTDGRDTDPKSALHDMRKLNHHIGDSQARLATITGRYYAMDRDRRWERTQIAYNALVRGKGDNITNVENWLKENYLAGRTDEFLLPGVLQSAREKGFRGIKNGDVVFFFNFRTDRPRQLSMALSQVDFPDFGMKKLDLKFLTMTRYDEKFEGVEVLFEKENLRKTLGEVISMYGKTQIRIAETEKYPHVTFFFSGGREKAFEGEDRILIPSPKVPTYDMQPEMSAIELTDGLIQRVERSPTDFICLNYANPDMVGHTGNFSAAVKAVETVDRCLAKLLPVLEAHQYEILIIADHGN
nr:2,3-bisphosphoglycerate-independent phosphoglycerate mutase [Saprospiraceae bacterium]